MNDLTSLLKFALVSGAIVSTLGCHGPRLLPTPVASQAAPVAATAVTLRDAPTGAFSQTIEGVESGVAKGSYHGTARVTIQYCDIDVAGAQTCGDSKSFTRDIDIVITPPQSCGTAKEDGPFHLELIADQDPKAPKEGELWLFSGGRFLTLDGNCVLLQHWRLRLVKGRLNGTLEDAHVAEARVRNVIWAWTRLAGVVEFVGPYTIAEGAVISGTLTTQQARLRLKGMSVDHTRRFVAQITAKREN